MSENKTYKKQVRVFLGVFILLVATTSIVNIYFNPYATFSNYQFEKRVVVSDRMQKCLQVKGLSEKPEAFVLGSSNSMRFLPKTIDSLTGLNAYNYGVFHARVEDFWCISNVILKDFKLRPKLVLFCIDDWNFADEPAPPDEFFEGAEKRLAFKPIYAKYLDDYSTGKLLWNQFKASINVDQTTASLDVLKDQLVNGRTWTKEIVDYSTTFFDDGVRIRYGTLGSDRDVTEEAESGQFDVTQSLMSTHEDWKKYPKTNRGILSDSHEMFENFSPRRLELFVRTIELLEENGCKVILNLMPLQPYYKSLVLETTNYSKRIDHLKNFLAWLKLRHHNILLVQDNTDISYFSGHENHFFHNIHPTSVNSDLMLFRLFREIDVNAF